MFSHTPRFFGENSRAECYLFLRSVTAGDGIGKTQKELNLVDTWNFSDASNLVRSFRTAFPNSLLVTPPALEASLATLLDPRATTGVFWTTSFCCNLKSPVLLGGCCSSAIWRILSILASDSYGHWHNSILLPFLFPVKNRCIFIKVWVNCLNGFLGPLRLGNTKKVSTLAP